MTTIRMSGIALEIDDALEWRDDDGTLVAYLPETDFANLRISLMTIAKEGNPVAGGGTRLLRREAERQHAEVRELGEKLWCHYVEPSSQGAPGSSMHYWYVGIDAHFIIISCFVDADFSSDERTGLVLSSIPALLASIEVEASQ